MISALPDDLLVQILLFLPTEDAVITMIMSKLWRLIWTMIPKLDYNDRYKKYEDSHVKLLSSCPVLKKLSVLRDEFDDNVTTFIVKVPSLENLIYESSQKGCSRNLPISWNQPSSVPVCLLSHLEIFQFKGYRKRREEKLFVAYILANSKCLKTAGISLRSS
ncbi:hypothetical protein BRARA_H00363 [Brassica rapa]|uniref:F-box domain-containing protein n=1 Tax=Brassica campestris TaxID=3711 RepID=A0A397Y9I1_BRACM|nr:hypothetical protein BRARA_H00363 [Brassica rapa]